MQIAQEDATASAALGVAPPESSAGGRSPYSKYKLIRRNGAVVGFEPAKITEAMTKAFLAVNGSQAAASARIRELVADLPEAVVRALERPPPPPPGRWWARLCAASRKAAPSTSRTCRIRSSWR